MDNIVFLAMQFIETWLCLHNAGLQYEQEKTCLYFPLVGSGVHKMFSANQ